LSTIASHTLWTVRSQPYTGYRNSNSNSNFIQINSMIYDDQVHCTIGWREKH